MPLLRKVCKYCISLCASFAQNVQWVNKFTLIKYQLSIFTFLCRFYSIYAILSRIRFCRDLRFFCVNFWGQKLRLRKFFDKYDVWGDANLTIFSNFHNSDLISQLQERTIYIDTCCARYKSDFCLEISRRSKNTKKSLKSPFSKLPFFY